jgi:gliding motility-associated-like protein
MKSVLIIGFLASLATSSLSASPQYFITTDTCRIPTLITPNDDGQNDELIIPCLPKNKADNQSELFIFSEWGERVAFYKPYLNEWEGTFKSRPLPDGTYFYIFRLTPTSDAQRGYITIFR